MCYKYVASSVIEMYQGVSVLWEYDKLIGLYCKALVPKLFCC